MFPVAAWDMSSAANTEGEADADAQPIVGCALSIVKLRSMIQKLGQSDCTVLIVGETGTGKELVARAIHACSPHRNKPFIAVDCAALAPTLIESELFGHAEGAFTGARSSRQGLLEAADGGTLFFDEIGDLCLSSQAKLLRALQEHQIRRVGSLRLVALYARIIAATNYDLKQATREGTFRKDLYFRLKAVVLEVPPLRERKQDIPALIDHFLSAASQGAMKFADDALACLLAHDWPGNVRELQAALQHAVALGSGPVFTASDLPSEITHLRQPLPVEEVVRELKVSLTLRELERQAILRAVQQSRGNKILAARVLGIGKTTLYRRLKEIAGT
jgi:two-component system response regulator HydG